MLNPQSCYRALLTHDRRFDGAFYVAVSSTGVYCRTVCTAKTPSVRNCRFFKSAAEAENAGYRPCLRCRPELAPGNACIDAAGRTAAIIAGMIEDGALNQMSVARLAEELGMSQRHLRRVVVASFGVSPLELAQTQRLLMAKRLLADSDLSVTEVAYASGFSSLRRFNAVLKERYELSPSEMRSRKATQNHGEAICCQLSYRTPFDWDSLLNFLRMRSAGGVEYVVDGHYCRTARIAGESGWLSVRNEPSRCLLKVEVSTGLVRVLMPLLNRLKRLFDLNADPQQISEHLDKLAIRNPGLRLPGAFDGFEIAVRAVLGQQVSVKAATTLMTRFCDLFGTPVQTPFEELTRLFPSAETVAQIAPAKFVDTGISSARVATICALAQAVASGDLSLEQAVDPEQRIEQLKQLPGIGDWTAHYIAMRVLNYPDAFPHSDLGIQKALGVHSERKILSQAECWRPWRAYAAMHLWKSLEV